MRRGGEPLYRHRQSGTVTRVMLGLALAYHLLLLTVLPAEGEGRVGRWVLIGTGVLLAAALVTFGSLTITVDRERVRWQFGPGPIAKSLALDDIVQASPTRMSALSGWGIRWTRRGWLYNVSGLDAVELTLRSGKRIFLGTDEPARLAAAIEEALGRAA